MQVITSFLRVQRCVFVHNLRSSLRRDTTVQQGGRRRDVWKAFTQEMDSVLRRNVGSGLVGHLLASAVTLPDSKDIGDYFVFCR